MTGTYGSCRPVDLLGPGAARSSAFALGVSLLAAAAPAAAYVLPADAILAGVAKRRSELGFETLVLEGYRGMARGPNAPTVWLAIKPGVGNRLEVKRGNETTVTLTVGRRRWTFTEGSRPGRRERMRADLNVDFLGATELDPEGKRGLAFCDAHRIDDEIVNLGRIDQRVAYVIGAKSWEPDRPQLWIDKGFNVPVRLIAVDKKTKSVTDTRLLGYGSAQTGEWYPQRIEVWRDGELVERTMFTRARVNEPLNDGLFRPPSR